MKKLISIVLVPALLLTLAGCLSGCKKEQKPLRILYDFSTWNFEQEQVLDELRQHLIDCGLPEDFEIEVLSTEDDERKIQLTRIRTEMMAGGGPDVFLSNRLAYIDALFLMPEKTMKLGLLYPLDDYIEKAQYMDWDRLNPTVMAAGRSEEYGQVILPLSYTFPMKLFMPEDVAEIPNKDTTWADMLNDETKLLTAVAAIGCYMDFGDQISGKTYLAESLGELADYENNQLLFTEDELLIRMQEIGALLEAKRNGGFDRIPEFFAVNGMYAWYGDENDDFFGDTISRFGENGTRRKKTENTELTMVPIYSDDGGVTATIQSMAAINANTKRIDDAFLVLDALMEPEFMAASSLFADDHLGSTPVYDDFMTRENRISAPGIDHSKTIPVRIVDKWAMTPSNFARYTAARDQITHVIFNDRLTNELNTLSFQSINIFAGYQDGDIEELVHTTYTRMKRELSE